MDKNGRRDLGDIVEAYCPTCRLNLNASVAALLENGAIGKVQCRTCGNFHAYKPPVPDEVRREQGVKRALNIRKKRGAYVPEATYKRGGKVVKTTVRTPDFEVRAPVDPAAKSEWERLTEGVTSRQATIYRESKGYSVGDYLIHKKHGLGYVKEVREVEGEGWAIVIFRECTDTIPMNRPIEY